MIKDSKDGAILPLKIIPKAAKNALVGWENEELKVRLNAIPEKGEANEELISFLSKTWKIPKSYFVMHSGQTNRHKKLLIKGVSSETLMDIINNSLKR